MLELLRRKLEEYRAKDTADQELVRICQQLLDEREEKVVREIIPTPSSIKVCWMMFILSVLGTLVLVFQTPFGFFGVIPALGFGISLVRLYYETDEKSGKLYMGIKPVDKTKARNQGIGV